MKHTLLPILLAISLPLAASKAVPVTGKCSAADQLAIDSQLKEVAALYRENQQLFDEDPTKVHGNAADVLVYLAEKNDLRLAIRFYKRLEANSAYVTVGRPQSIAAACEPVATSQSTQTLQQQGQDKQGTSRGYVMPSFFAANNWQKLFGEDTTQITFAHSKKQPVITLAGSDVKKGANSAPIPMESSSAAADEKEYKSQHMSAHKQAPIGSEDDQRQIELGRFMSLLGEITPEEWKHTVWNGNIGLYTRILLGSFDLQESYRDSLGHDHKNVMVWLACMATNDLNNDDYGMPMPGHYKERPALDIVFERMCKDGADHLNDLGEEGHNLMHPIVQQYNKKWVALLVKYGADPEQRFKGNGSLHSLVAGTPPEAGSTALDQQIHQLLIFGLNIDQKDDDGISPLALHALLYPHRQPRPTHTWGVKLRMFGATPLDQQEMRELEIPTEHNDSLELEAKDADAIFRSKMSKQLQGLRTALQYGVFKNSLGCQPLYNELAPIINDYVGLTLFSSQKEPELAEAVEALDRRRAAAMVVLSKK